MTQSIGNDYPGKPGTFTYQYHPPTETGNQDPSTHIFTSQMESSTIKEVCITQFHNGKINTTIKVNNCSKRFLEYLNKQNMSASPLAKFNKEITVPLQFLPEFYILDRFVSA